MKLQTQFKFPNKDLRCIDYVNKVEALGEILRESVKITQLNKIV